MAKGDIHLVRTLVCESSTRTPNLPLHLMSRVLFVLFALQVDQYLSLHGVEALG